MSTLNYFSIKQTRVPYSVFFILSTGKTKGMFFSRPVSVVHGKRIPTNILNKNKATLYSLSPSSIRCIARHIASSGQIKYSFEANSLALVMSPPLPSFTSNSSLRFVPHILRIQIMHVRKFIHNSMQHTDSVALNLLSMHMIHNCKTKDRVHNAKFRLGDRRDNVHPVYHALNVHAKILVFPIKTYSRNITHLTSPAHPPSLPHPMQCKDCNVHQPHWLILLICDNRREENLRVHKKYDGMKTTNSRNT